MTRLDPLNRLDRLTPRAIVNVVVVGGAALFVLLQLQPHLLLTNTTPAGGDMGAHVWGPAWLRDHLLPHWRLSGWAPSWYDGFPALHFYFPLPSILIVLLNAVIPYDVAFKLVTVSGLVSLPICAYWFARNLGLRFPGPALFGLATVPFMFDRFHTIYGGNVPATLAGEFSFSIGLSFALLFLGVFAKGLETGRHRGWAAALLAATVLCHLLPTLLAVAGAGVLLLLRLDRHRLRYALTSLPVAGALASFWAVPFVWRLPYSNDMGWEKLTLYVRNLFPFLHGCPAGGSCGPGQFPRVQTWHMLPVTILALIGAVAAVALRRRAGLFLVAMTGLALAAFRFAPPARLWNARALPFWFLGLYLLAAFGLTEMATLAADAWRRVSPSVESWLLALPVAGLVAVVVFVALPLGALPGWFPLHTSDHSFVPDWARWNYSGYEAKPLYHEYRDVVATMGALGRRDGCGRAFWEYKPELDQYGTPMALMLLPYWTHGCIDSMEGLFFESAATTPYHFLLQSEGSKTPSRAQRDMPYRDLVPPGQPAASATVMTEAVQHMQLLGVRYYMAVSPEAIAAAEHQPALTPLASSGPWRIYRVAASQLVTPLADEPAVVTGLARKNGAWLDVSVPWYQDSTRWDVPLAQSGPASWPRVTVHRTASADPTVGSGVTVDKPPARAVRPTRVSAIRTGDDRISFDVDRPGSPVLVKVSYFPNWQASGAKGPWRVTPNLMVVIPTARHVSLHYGRTPVDWLGILLTVLGLAAVVGLWRAGPLSMPVPPVEAEAEADGDQLAFEFAGAEPWAPEPVQVGPDPGG
jgi:6-pyruvoyl-tetrahydropterin synthase related domain